MRLLQWNRWKMTMYTPVVAHSFHPTTLMNALLLCEWALHILVKVLWRCVTMGQLTFISLTFATMLRRVSLHGVISFRETNISETWSNCLLQCDPFVLTVIVQAKRLNLRLLTISFKVLSDESSTSLPFHCSVHDCVFICTNFKTEFFGKMLPRSPFCLFCRSVSHFLKLNNLSNSKLIWSGFNG